MAGIKISDLPPNTLPLVGDEQLELEDASGDSTRATVDDIIAAASGLDATFITVSANASLPNERVLTAGTNVSLVDSGPNGTLTINVSGGGFGDVFKVGVPVDNQLAVWTGDGTLEGSSEFIVDGDEFRSDDGNGPLIRSVATATTIPVFIPRQGDPNTGISNAGDDRLGLVAGGVAGMILVETNSGVVHAFDSNVAITAFAGGGQGSATDLVKSYNVVGTVASPGDSVLIQGSNQVGSVVYIKNDGANACDVFPASGDDLGFGIDVPYSLAAGDSVAFILTISNTTWTQLLGLGVGGAGDVFKVGVPVDNQIGVWTGDGTIEGDPNFTWDGAASQLLLPQVNTPAVPTLAFGDGDSGFYENADDFISVALAGVREFAFGPGVFQGVTVGSAQLRNEVASDTNPTLIPASNSDTGIGSIASASISTIASSIEAERFTQLGGGILQKMAPDTTITAFAGGGQGSATLLRQSYNVITVVATTGDSVKFPAVFAVGTLIYVKNDDLNACDVFPAAGGDLGAGTNVAVSVGAGKSLTFIATTADSTWTQLIVVPAGAGDVIKVGTPVDNQVGVWTGDGTIEGDPNFEWTGTQLIVGVTGSAAAPAIAFGDGDSGFVHAGANVIRVSLSGVSRFFWEVDAFNAETGTGPAMLNVASGALIPVFVPRRSDPNTGLASAGLDILTLVAGGVEMLRATEAGTSATDQILLPRDGAEATPALALGAADRGWWSGGVAQINASIGGSRVQFFSSSGLTQIGSIGVELAAGPRMLNETASDTNPVINVRQNDADSGLGSRVADAVNIIGGGVSGVEYAEASSHIIQTNEEHVGLTASVTQTQVGGLALLSSYNEIATVANEGDALTAFGVAEGSRLVVVNNGANGLQLFPASGDNFGAGVDASITIAANSVGVFLGRDATNWDPLQNQSASGSVFQGLGIWRYRTETTSPPATGQVRFNNADPTLATEMFLAETNSNGTDVNNFLNLMTPGSVFYIQDKSEAANFFLVEINSNTDNGTDRTFGIENITLQGVEPSQNSEVLIVASEAGPVLTANDAVQARRTTDYTLTTAFVDVTLDTTDVETDAAVLDHDLVTNTDNIIAGVSGTYKVSYQFNITNASIVNTMIEAQARVRLNDAGTGIPGSLASEFNQRQHGEQFTTRICCDFVVTLAATDFITLQAQKIEIDDSQTYTISEVSVKATRLI